MKHLILLVAASIMVLGSFAQGQYLMQPQYLPQVQANPFVVPGMPVPGAPYDPTAYSAGSGVRWMSSCPYAQAQTRVNGVENDPGVVGAKEDLDGIQKHLAELRKDLLEAKRAYNTALPELNKALGNQNGDALVKAALVCEKLAEDNRGATAPEWNKILRSSRELKSDTEKAGCSSAAINVFGSKPNSDGYVEKGKMCVSERYPLTAVPDTPYREINAAPNVSVAKSGACFDALRNAADLFKKQRELEDQYKEQQKKLADADKALRESRTSAEEFQKLEDQVKADEGVNAQNQGCRECEAAAQQQKPSINKLELFSALGAASFLSWYGIHEAGVVANHNAQLGFTSNPLGVTQGQTILGAVGNGFSVGGPFINNAMYGQVPAGYTYGGTGCAPMTYSNVPPWAQQGPYYYPGQQTMPMPFPGSYMAPGVSPWMVAQSPFGPGYGPGGPFGPPGGPVGPFSPYGPGYGPGGPFGPGGSPFGPGFNPYGPGYSPYGPGGGSGYGYNPYMGALLDAQRRDQVALYQMSAGLNAANQGFAQAASILNSSSSFNSFGYGSPYAFGQTGFSNFGQVGSPFGVAGPIGVPGGCPPSLLGAHFSICGNVNFGGSNVPTFVNGPLSAGIPGVPAGVPYNGSIPGAGPIFNTTPLNR